MKNLLAILSIFTLLLGCSTAPPKHPEDICQIFREKDDWYDDTLRAARRWGIPIAVQMAIIYQESSFVDDAKPPRPLILGFIPWFRSSSAYGYPQAKDETWADYQKASGNSWADRDDFGDSCDFVAWYCSVSRQKLGIAEVDTKSLYLSYHEGWNGYRNSSHLPKQWLLNAAQKAHKRSLQYDAQLSGCRQELDAKN